jgi:hypothetical protein
VQQSGRLLLKKGATWDSELCPETPVDVKLQTKHMLRESRN